MSPEENAISESVIKEVIHDKKTTFLDFLDLCLNVTAYIYICFHVLL